MRHDTDYDERRLLVTRGLLGVKYLGLSERNPQFRKRVMFLADLLLQWIDGIAVQAIIDGHNGDGLPEQRKPDED